MTPLSVEMACLLGIQNKIQAVCSIINWRKFLLQNNNFSSSDSDVIKKRKGQNLHFFITTLFMQI